MGTTYVAKTGEVTNQWYVVDGTDQNLGRLAAKIAMVLMGKHKPVYTPHVDTGDYVVVVNADKIRVSPANKPRNRVITYHTGWLGGLKQQPVTEAFERNPAKVLTLAVKRMLPKNKLARQQITKLRVFRGPEHAHVAQQPQPFPAHL